MKKIAVCLSGQPRSIEYCVKNIRQFFESDDREVDYFCHVWDYNTWKVRDTSGVNLIKIEPKEMVDKEKLREQLQLFAPVKYIIDSELVNTPIIYSVWSSINYSMMMANHLKKQHESEHNMAYDCVVKCRYDSVFSPDCKFDDTLADLLTVYHYYFGRMPAEYMKLNASDTVFYGSSWAMNIVSDIYYHLSDIYKNYTVSDCFSSGPGTLISDYTHKYNIRHEQSSIYPKECIYRKEVSGLDAISDFDKIFKNYRTYYE